MRVLLALLSACEPLLVTEPSAFEDAGSSSDAGGLVLVDAGGLDSFLFPYRPSNFWPDGETAILPYAQDQLVVPEEASCRIDTDEGSIDCAAVRGGYRLPGSPPLFVLPLTRLEIAGEVTVSGSAAVVFAVFGDAILDGLIRLEPGGPGADDDSVCASSFGRSGGVGEGGSGAGHLASGGIGAPGVEAGGARGEASIEPLAGGCRGGGLGGRGGGAIQISATKSVRIERPIFAGGGGGRGGNDGGGGGGSGGAILIEAIDVTLGVGAFLNTSGGGGGAGGDGTSGGDGDDGDMIPQPNGGSHPNAGSGGAGGIAPDTPIAGRSTGIGGGGGGGGSVGRIRINAVSCAIAPGNLTRPALDLPGVLNCERSAQ